MTVTLSRKDTSQKDSSDQQIAEMLVNFGGGPKFALSVGLGLGGLKQREFNREQSIDASTGDVTNIVGLGEDSDYRFIPMLFLHGMVTEYWSVTAGLGPHSDDDGTNVDAFLGMSRNFASRGRVSFGAYFGKEQELGGGFEVGDSIPDEIAELPVRKSNEVGVGLFFSWTLSN